MTDDVRSRPQRPSAGQVLNFAPDVDTGIEYPERLAPAPRIKGLPRPLTPPGLSRPLLRKFHWQLLWLYHDAARLKDAPLAAELAQLEAMQRRISIALGTHRASDDKE